MSQTCRVKMLRDLCLLSLLICVNITFCYEYTSNNEWNNSPKYRKIREETNHRYRTRNVEERRFRKRHDYDMAYDKDPVAQIDVANFIKSPEDESFGENDPYDLQYNNIKRVKNNNDYRNLNKIKFDENVYNNDDYSDMNAESLQENSINLNFDDISMQNKNEKTTPGLDHIHNDLNDESSSKSNTHYQHKKCALKNMKLPFFSHNKSATIKAKKNKKRKLHNLIKLRKGKNSKQDIDTLPNKNNVYDGQNPHKYYEIHKRSYLEQICPACKRKFLVNQQLDLKDKRGDILKQYYKTRQTKNDESNSENVNESKNKNKGNIDDNFMDNNEVDFKESWRDRRRKREGENRNIERQKELDDLERRIESVSVARPAYNKANSKT